MSTSSRPKQALNAAVPPIATADFRKSRRGMPLLSVITSWLERKLNTGSGTILESYCLASARAFAKSVPSSLAFGDTILISQHHLVDLPVDLLMAGFLLTAVYNDRKPVTPTRIRVIITKQFQQKPPYTSAGRSIYMTLDGDM
jgi:hypothetical protein